MSVELEHSANGAPTSGSSVEAGAPSNGVTSLQAEPVDASQRYPAGSAIPGTKLQQHICALNVRGATGFTGYDEEFALLEQKSDTNFFGDFQEALKHVNRPKNRYSNVLPLDRTRVLLGSLPDEQGSDYINANYVEGMYPKQYIASQGPLKETAANFWRMILEQRCNVIVMLTRVIENHKQKCVQYWPKKDHPKVFGDIEVVLQEKQREHGLVIRTIELRRADAESRIVTHFQYKEWPDHGLPSSAATFRHLLHLVDASHDGTGPISVHCSAGIGRTGTFCTVHTVIQQLEHRLKQSPSEIPEFDIFGTILKLRGDRVGMVQTKDQYEFCYKAVNEEYEGQIKRIHQKDGDKRQRKDMNDEL